ncbi:universal stress protein [Streptomyces sp. NBC_00882]|nr:universal stress protein [Streptomyces sp. NBC_00882]WSZ55309.1 universal stress protein [Streptomyces canus]
MGLRLVHAFGWPSKHLPPGRRTPWNPPMAGVDGTLSEAEERARRAVPQVDVTREVTVGEPLTVREIESRTASLVVVGSRGLGAFGGLLPVLRGRPDPDNPELPAVDGSSAGESAVEFAFTDRGDARALWIVRSPSGHCGPNGGRLEGADPCSRKLFRSPGRLPPGRVTS